MVKNNDNNMLEHDRVWNWNVKRGDKVRCDVTEKGRFGNEYEKANLIEGEEYEVVYPQGTPSGICVKNIKTNEEIWGEHAWFTKIN